jgi:hypothetical protein
MLVAIVKSLWLRAQSCAETNPLESHYRRALAWRLGAAH